MRLSELLFETDVKNIGADVEIAGVTCDSRKVKPRFLFFALPGMHADGADFAKEAQKNGAAVCIAEREIPGLQIPQAVSQNARRSYAKAVAAFYGNPQDKLKIIGITGTNGKTSTAHFLWKILNLSGRPAVMIGTCGCRFPFENRTASAFSEQFCGMTTPDPEVLYPILSAAVDDGLSYAVLEVSSHALSLEKVAPIAFALSVFTNFSEDHLDFYPTMDAYLAAKARLFSQSEIGVFDLDDPALAAVARATPCRVVGYGRAADRDYSAAEIETDKAGSTYILHSKNARFRVRTRICGDFAVENTLAAAAAARELGVDFISIQDAIWHLERIDGRFERVDFGHPVDFSVYIDYAHTPDALERLLKSARALVKGGGRLIALLGCGGDRERQKRSRMGRIAAENCDCVYFTNDNCRTEDPGQIMRDITSELADDGKFTVIYDRADAICAAVNSLKKDDVLLLCGKGHEQYEIDADGRHPFSETEIVRAAVVQRDLKGSCTDAHSTQTRSD